MTIAGHSFRYGYCECGRKWTDIRYSDDASLGHPNIAHVGTLNGTELEEIRQEVVAEDARISDAMASVLTA